MIKYLGSYSRILFLRLYAAGASFAITLFLGRLLGSAGFGAYSFAMNWVSIGVLFTTLGFQHFVIRAIPPMVIHNRQAEVSGLILLSALITTLLSFIVILASRRVVFKTAIETDLQLALALGLLLLLPMTWNQLRTGVLQGLGHPVAGQLPERLVQPSFIFLGVASCWLTGVSLRVNDVLLITLAATLIAFAVGLVFLVPVIRKVWTRPIDLHPGIWMAGAAKSSLWFAAATVMGATDTVMLGTLSTPSETGLYGVAARFFMLMALPLSAASVLMSQRAAKFYAANDIVALEDIVRKAALRTFLSSILLAILSTLAAFNVVFLFGVGFEGAFLPILILVWSRAAVSVFGEPASALANTAFMGTVSIVVILFAMVNFGMNALLIPEFGANGAATATAISFLLMGLLFAYLVKKRLGIRPYPKFFS